MYGGYTLLVCTTYQTRQTPSTSSGIRRKILAQAVSL